MGLPIKLIFRNEGRSTPAPSIPRFLQDKLTVYVRLLNIHNAPSGQPQVHGEFKKIIFLPSFDSTLTDLGELDVISSPTASTVFKIQLYTTDETGVVIVKNDPPDKVQDIKYIDYRNNLINGQPTIVKVIIQDIPASVASARRIIIDSLFPEFGKDIKADNC